MDKKLLTEINQLAVDNPGINLMKKHFVALVQNAGKHGLHDRIACHSLRVKQVYELTTLESFFHDLLGASV